MIVVIPWRLSELPPGAVTAQAERCGPFRSPWEYRPERQCAAYLIRGGRYAPGSYRRCALLAPKGREFCGKHQPMFGAPT